MYVSSTNRWDVCISGRCHHDPKVDEYNMMALKGLAFYGVQLL